MKIKGHKFTKEFTKFYKLLATKPDVELCIETDKRIREMKESGSWATLDILYDFNMPIEEFALIDWTKELLK